MSDMVPNTGNDTEITPEQKELNSLTDAVKLILGPTFKVEDKEILEKQMEIIKDECLEVANRMFDTSLTDFKSAIVQCGIIWYENRGVESQTRQGELGQENHFIDWHQYLRDVVANHGKRYVI